MSLEEGSLTLTLTYSPHENDHDGPEVEIIQLSKEIYYDLNG